MSEEVDKYEARIAELEKEIKTLKKEKSELELRLSGTEVKKVWYGFNFYMKNPNNNWGFNGITTAALQWDTMITLYGHSLENAMLQMPEEYEGYRIVKVDYPTGYPSFPLFPPSTSTAGYQHNLEVT